MLTITGLRIIEDPTCLDHWIDWSGCRSPSRAMRRLRQGHPQRCVQRGRPSKGAWIDRRNGIARVHPETAKALRDYAIRRIDAEFIRAVGQGSSSFASGGVLSPDALRPLPLVGEAVLPQEALDRFGYGAVSGTATVDHKAGPVITADDLERLTRTLTRTRL